MFKGLPFKRPDPAQISGVHLDAHGFGHQPHGRVVQPDRTGHPCAPLRLDRRPETPGWLVVRRKLRASGFASPATQRLAGLLRGLDTGLAIGQAVAVPSPDLKEFFTDCGPRME